MAGAAPVARVGRRGMDRAHNANSDYDQLMRISLLGPLEVRDGDEVIPVPGAKLQALLSALALRANHQVSTSTLTEVLWGDEPPARSDASLHNHVARLRRTLRDTGAVRLTAAHSAYRLKLSAGELDVDDFQAAGGSMAASARTCASAWGAPSMRSMPASSHSTEIGPA